MSNAARPYEPRALPTRTQSAPTLADLARLVTRLVTLEAEVKRLTRKVSDLEGREHIP